MPKLKRYKSKNDIKNSKYLVIALSIILCIGIVIVINISHALYKDENQYDVIKSKIGNWLFASGLIYDNTNSGIECTDVECALDYLYDKFD